MKIDQTSSGSVQDLYIHKDRKPPQSSVTGSLNIRQDRATLGSGKQSIQATTDSNLSDPSVRSEKVAALRDAIGNGTYKVDANTLASAFLAGGSGMAR